MHNIKKLIGSCVLVLLLCGCGDKALLLTTGDVEEYTATTADMEYGLTENDGQNPEAEVDVASTTEAADGTQMSEPEMVAIYVCGAVRNPGVYYVSATAIKETVVRMAGGFLDEADENYVNLAQTVTGGEQIYIPTRDETVGLSLSSRESVDSQKTDASEEADVKININTAEKEQLMTLPGIGESKADAIIAYREAQGRFQSTDELMNIQGIKEGVYNKIKDLIIVG